jgi:hypothetical protein
MTFHPALRWTIIAALIVGLVWVGFGHRERPRLATTVIATNAGVGVDAKPGRSVSARPFVKKRHLRSHARHLRTKMAHARPRGAGKSASMPYSCATVRWAVSTYSRAQLVALARRFGVTSQQRAQASHCLHNPRA